MINIEKVIDGLVTGVIVVALVMVVRTSQPVQPVVQNNKMDDLVTMMMLQMMSDMKDSPTAEAKFGGIYHQTIEEFYAGLRAGSSNQFVVDGSGNITSGSITSSGAISGTTITGTDALTGTSATFTGAITSDSPTFVVDATNNRVGMGTTTPTALLTVGSTTPTNLTSGNYYKSAFIDSELEVGGASWFTGAMRLFSTLIVDGATTLSSTLGVTATTTVGTTDLVIQTDLNRIGVATSTPLGLFHIEDQTASTSLIMSTGLASNGASLILEDTDGAGCSEIMVLDGVVTAITVACPTGI